MNDVQVFRVSWGTRPWRVQCNHCETMVRGFRRWRTALLWARVHAGEHEARRCKSCGRTS